jgi:hypothetical protein
MYYPIIRQCIQALKNLETWLDNQLDRRLSGYCGAPRLRSDGAGYGWGLLGINRRTTAARMNS